MSGSFAHQDQCTLAHEVTPSSVCLAAYRKLAMKWHPVRFKAVLLGNVLVHYGHLTHAQCASPADSAAMLSQDKNPNNREVAEKKFKQISEAYDVRAAPWTSASLAASRPIAPAASLKRLCRFAD